MELLKSYLSDPKKMMMLRWDTYIYSYTYLVSYMYAYVPNFTTVRASSYTKIPGQICPVSKKKIEAFSVYWHGGHFDQPFEVKIVPKIHNIR